jgi:peroxiredoxin
VLLGFFAMACAPVAQQDVMLKSVGDRAPIFSAATSQGKLFNYDLDYYGKHHLVMTFFPAAYTPI